MELYILSYSAIAFSVSMARWYMFYLIEHDEDIQYIICAGLIWPYVIGRYVIRGCCRVITNRRFGK